MSSDDFDTSKPLRNHDANARLLLFVIALMLFNLSVSIYLVVDYYNDSEHSFCDFGSHVSCTKVKNSAFAVMFNVPIAVFGVLWSVVALVLTLAAYILEQARTRKTNHYLAGLFLWMVLGGAFVIYLICAEFMLRTICPTCTVVHVITVISLILVWRCYERETAKPTVTEVLLELKLLVVAVGLVALFLVVFFNVAESNTLPEADMSRVDEGFAKCVGESGWNFYGITGCGYCERQKRLFGEHLEHINFIDCNVYDCSSKQLQGYPTWILEVDGKETQRWTGFASLKNLEAFTTCDLNTD